MGWRRYLRARGLRLRRCGRLGRLLAVAGSEDIGCFANCESRFAVHMNLPQCTMQSAQEVVCLHLVCLSSPLDR